MHRALVGCLRHQHAAARVRPSSSPGRYSSAWRPLSNRHLRASFPTSKPSLPNPRSTNSAASQRTHCTSANPTAAPFPAPALASARQGGVPAPTASTASSQPHLARCNRMATAASAVAAGAGGGGGGEEGPTHVLVVCGTPEDSQRIAAAVKEISPGLVFHTDAASLPPAAWPAFDAAACAARLHRSSGGGDGDGGGGGADGGHGRTMGRVLLVAGVMGSTQELLRAHGSALGDGAVVVADRQTSGKGRGGNQWTSPLGCLMFSALRRLRVQSPAQAPFINYLVCLAVTRGVRAALQSLALPALDVRIKWPNDIYASGVKIAGALIHTTWQGNCFNVITGIGLNVNNRQPTTCLDELLEKAAAAAGPAAAGATAAAAAAAAPLAPLPREVVLAEILKAMEDVFNTFERDGFAPLEPEYLAAWLHSGQLLDFDDSDPTQAQAQAQGGVAAQAPVRLTVRGLSPAGFLLGVDEAGQRYELTPDGNSLDMMRGLLRRKLPA